MFFEEHTVNGVTYYRTKPGAQWREMPLEMLQKRYAALKEERAAMEKEITELKLRIYQ